MRVVDMAGVEVGRLRVIHRHGSTGGKATWMCQCACGALSVVSGDDLRKGHVNSCGCLRSDATRGMKTTHSGSKLAEYKIWLGMRKRCLCPTAHFYERYGGRGIRVCERWDSFPAFLADMGHRPTPRHSLDRINNDGDYEPSNCRWATKREQARNMSTNRHVVIGGVVVVQAEAARLLGVSPATICRMVKSGRLQRAA